MLKVSCAFTVNMNWIPAEAEAGAITLKWVAVGVELTFITGELPVIEAVSVSVTVMLSPVAVFSVAENDPVIATPENASCVGPIDARPSLVC